MSEVEVKEDVVEEQAAEVSAEEEAPRRKKKRYTRGLARLQKAEVHMSLGDQQIANAVARGLKTWRKRADKSARRRRDGALRDSMVNAAAAYGEFLRHASRAPEHYMRAVGAPSPRKMMRMMMPF